MTGQFKPSSWRVLCFINAAFVYAGALFIYMGSSSMSAPLSQVLQSTSMPPSVIFIIISGSISALGGVAGMFMLFKRNEKKLRRHFWILLVLVFVFLATTVVSLVLFLAASVDLVWLTSMEPQLSENYVNEICPAKLGYLCHGVPMLFHPDRHGAQSYLVNSFWLGPQMAKYRDVLSIPNNLSAPFSQLCVNASDRMKLLPALYAFNLNSSYQMCAALESSLRLPPIIDGESFWENDIMGCRGKMFGDKFPFAIYFVEEKFEMASQAEIYTLTKLKTSWLKFAQSMSIASGSFSAIAMLQLYEVRRTLKEFLLAQSS